MVALSPPSCGRYRWRGGRFDAWSPGRRLALLTSAALFALLAFACSPPEPGRVRVVVDAADGNRWYAEGPAVDDGRLCAEGLHQATGHEDLLSGEALMPAQVEYRNRQIIAAPDPEARVDYVVIAEWTCSDGSGVVSVRVEPVEGGAWEVTGGRGAYVGLAGGGSVTVERPEGPPAWRNPAVLTTMELRGVLTVEN